MERLSKTDSELTDEDLGKLNYSKLTGESKVEEALGEEQVVTWKDIFNLAMLSVNHITSFWVSFLIVYVNVGTDPFTNLQVDLKLTEAQYGMLSGTSFALTQILFSLFNGFIVDQVSRKYILVVTGLLWGLLTFAQSYVTNFPIFLIIRILSLIPVSTVNACCNSLISDYFCAKYRARASSIYALGAIMGVALSSLTIVLVNQVGWRNSFKIVSGVSLFFTLLTFFITDPKRGVYNTAAKDQELRNVEGDVSRCGKVRNDLKKVLSNKIFLFICAGGALRISSAYAIGFWSVKFFNNVYPSYQNLYGVLNAASILTINVASIYIGGAIGDYYKDTHPEVNPLLCGYGIAVGYPLFFVALVISNNFYLTITLYFLAFLPSEVWMGNLYAMIQNIFPSQMIGTAIAVFGICGSVAGASASFLLGVLGEQFNTALYPERAGYLLAASLGVSVIGGAPIFTIVAVLYRRLMKKDRTESILIVTNGDGSEYQ